MPRRCILTMPVLRNDMAPHPFGFNAEHSKHDTGGRVIGSQHAKEEMMRFDVVLLEGAGLPLRQNYRPPR